MRVRLGKATMVPDDFRSADTIGFSASLDGLRKHFLDIARVLDTTDIDFRCHGIRGAEMDAADTAKALRGGIDAAYDASLPEGIDIMKFPVFYTASNVQEAYKRVQQKIVSKIDDYFASEVKVRVSGIGFYTDTLSDEKFVEFMRLHKAALTAPSAPIELRDIYENVVERHGRPEDFLVENSDFDCKASVIAYAMNNETILCAGQDIFDGMLGSKETDAENCSCVSVSDKEFARLHSKYNLKKEDVLEVIKAYAQELGLEYGPVNYFMMCDPKYANDLGEVVQ